MATAAPPNFSWVEPKKVAGLAYPCATGHYQFLFDSGIQHLVCLCESLPPHHDSCPGLQVHHIGIVDFTPPSFEQIKTFLSIVEEANSKHQGVGVHCMHGHGRTGTMLACYLVEKRKLSGEEAIKEIRRIRPGSIETRDQEKAVRDFHQNMQ
ncbi:dual specificity protein phosphatase 23-like [Alosa sapidissima]|uniref:dual specificity protein phosphatase 23-like n=1 Tax=Alosa sapidissima TaxID=34773 RepID=UPI001C0A1276|nr:dual specificity protein phosphatase 23-like [Alosa sapidissima]XP_041951576.1 dual specificity protein phosphatase 23-like [Alosa sapidissima]XP_041951577.1 dual specificity protein phosphatase 23-like [Alosa sapidissima]